MSKSFVVRAGGGAASGNIVALKELDLQVERGEIYGLLGPNGAGKTTAMRAAVGLLVPDKGRVTIQGADVRDRSSDVRSRFGYVAMDMRVYARFTPVEYLAFFGEVEGMTPRQAHRRALELLRRLDVERLGSVRMDGFSSGQQQRILLARALMHDPDVLILDEPTTGLDIVTGRKLLGLLADLRAEGKAILLSTHSLPMLERTCDRIGVLVNGEMLEEGAPKALLDRHGVSDIETLYFTIAHPSEARTEA